MTLAPRDFDLLASVLRVQSSTYKTRTMRRWAAQQLLDMGAIIRSDGGNLYATKGRSDAYPCFVAHLDTVHKIVPNDAYAVYVDHDDKAGSDVLWAYDTARKRQVGVGGDDKCGIFLALVMLRDLPACKVALFRDEEVGCLGADEARMDFFDDVAFVIEADRRGGADYVRDAGGVELHGDEWEEAFRPLAAAHGYAPEWGHMTDVMTLKEKGLGVAALNLSAGYYGPHTDLEYVVVDDVARAQALCHTVVARLGGRRWSHAYERKASRYRDEAAYWERVTSWGASASSTSVTGVTDAAALVGGDLYYRDGAAGRMYLWVENGEAPPPGYALYGGFFDDGDDEAWSVAGADDAPDCVACGSSAWVDRFDVYGHWYCAQCELYQEPDNGYPSPQARAANAHALGRVSAFG